MTAVLCASFCTIFTAPDDLNKGTPDNIGGYTSGCFMCYTVCKTDIDSEVTEKKMPYTKIQKDATIKYIKEKQKSIKLRILKEDYESRVEPAIKRSGLPVATFIKKAIDEKIERDGLNGS